MLPNLVAPVLTNNTHHLETVSCKTFISSLINIEKGYPIHSSPRFNNVDAFQISMVLILSLLWRIVS